MQLLEALYYLLTAAFMINFELIFCSLLTLRVTLCSSLLCNPPEVANTRAVETVSQPTFDHSTGAEAQRDDFRHILLLLRLATAYNYGESMQISLAKQRTKNIASSPPKAF